jgi:hypothetical protein
MTIHIDQAFVKKFETEVHETFQNKGGYLAPTVRTKTVVGAYSTTMQKVGQGEATQKSRHGEVPAMNVDFSPVEILLQDWYAKEYSDHLDELKTNIAERQVLINATVYALGRKQDQIISAAMNLTTVTDGGSGAFTFARALKILEMMGDLSIPDDGQRYAAVGWHTWAQLLTIPEFNNSQMVGGNLPLPRGTQAKNWLSFYWYPVEALPKSGNNRSNFFYHKSAVGRAIQEELNTDVWWNGEKQTNVLTSRLAMGAGIIDENGVVKALVDDTSAVGS